MKHTWLILTLLLVAAPLGAQAVPPDGIISGSTGGTTDSPLAINADFTTFHSGCVGTGTGRGGPGFVCTHGNGSATTLATTTFTTNAEFVVRHQALSARSIGGFQVLVGRSTAGVAKAVLYSGDSSGPKGNPVRVGLLAFSPDAAWATVTFDRPYVASAGEYYYPGFLNPSPSIKTIASTGSNLWHFWRSSTSASWMGPYNTQKWAIRILCSENPCQAANGHTTSSSGALVTSATFLIRLKAETNTRVSGFELPAKCTTAGQTETYLYRADSAGKPTGSPVRTGVMRFTPDTTWQSTRFHSPYYFPAGSFFFIGFLNPNPSLQPLASSGSNQTHFWKRTTATTWGGPFTSTRWAYKLNKEQAYCDSFNSTQTANSTAALTAKAIFALSETATSNLSIAGFELLLRGTAEGATEAYLYRADAAGMPTGSPVRTTTLRFGVGTTWARATFYAPYSISSGNRYCLAFLAPTTNTLYPIAASGSKATHYLKTTSSTTWSGPWTTQSWAYRVMCSTATVPSTPAMGNRGLPVLGKVFQVDLNFAKPTTAAVHLVGVSNTIFGPLKLPLDLGPLGAPGCNLLVSPDFAFSRSVSNSGYATMPFPVPSDKVLEGARIYHQWVVLDASVNPLRVVFSDGGASLLGR